MLPKLHQRRPLLVLQFQVALVRVHRFLVELARLSQLLQLRWKSHKLQLKLLPKTPLPKPPQLRPLQWQRPLRVRQYQVAPVVVLQFQEVPVRLRLQVPPPLLQPQVQRLQLLAVSQKQLKQLR